MQEKLTIARPYARAAYEHASSEGALPAWSELLSLLSVVVSDPAMRQVIGDPRVPAEKLADLVFAVCGARLFESSRNFVRLLIDAERLNVAPEIKQLFEEARAQAGGIQAVEVISAFPLEPAQVTAIAAAVKQKIGHEVEVATSEDRQLIGGVIVRAGDLVIDASVRGRLQQLAGALV